MFCHRNRNFSMDLMCSRISETVKFYAVFDEFVILLNCIGHCNDCARQLIVFPLASTQIILSTSQSVSSIRSLHQ